MTKTALQLIQQGWTQGTAARDKHGVAVFSYNDAAVCWCAAGAIGAAYMTGHEYYSAFKRLEEVVGSNITSWNDHPDRTQEEVIEAFVKAGI